MRITLTVGGIQLPATLHDNAAARDLAALLPLTLTVSDFNGNEKVADLPGPLSLDGAPAGHEARAGDINHYAPWGNLAIFYRDFPYSTGLVHLGRIDGPLGPLIDAPDGSTLTIAPVD